MRLGPLLKRFVCHHKETVLKVDAVKHRLYTECTECLCTSPGITTTEIAAGAFVPSRRTSTSALNRELGGGYAG